MFSVIATALGVATVAITLVSGPSTTAASGTAGGTLVDAQIVEVYVFFLAAFTGYQIITKVPPLLHTPLMAATNAISAISLVASDPSTSTSWARSPLRRPPSTWLAGS